MSQPKPVVVLAEDDQFLRRMYATKLQQSGMDVFAASDGELALRYVREHRPAVLLLDILMPKKDGFEVLEEIKADPALKKIPVVLLTNLGEPEDIKRARKLGADDYMIKSHFLPSEVIDVVRKYLSTD